MSHSGLLCRFSMLMLCGTAQCDARSIEVVKRQWNRMAGLIASLIPRDVLFYLN